MARKIFIFFIPVEIGNGSWLYFGMVGPCINYDCDSTSESVTIHWFPYNFACSCDQLGGDLTFLRSEFFKRLNEWMPARLEPNLISILSRVTNAVRDRFHIKQPRWSALRWKSKT